MIDLVPGESLDDKCQICHKTRQEVLCGGGYSDHPLHHFVRACTDHYWCEESGVCKICGADEVDVAFAELLADSGPDENGLEPGLD